MSKDPKDYLHLHIGCNIRVEPDLPIGNSGTVVLTGENLNLAIESGWKPELRPLSSMAAVEAAEICANIYEPIYGGFHLASKFDLEIISRGNDDEVGFIGTYKDFEIDRIGLTIEVERGIEFSVNSTRLKVNQFEIVQYLLSKHFDLFNLIESGLAIDGTKMKVRDTS